MRYCRRLVELLLGLALAVAVLMPGALRAAEIDLRDIRLTPTEEGGFVLAADLAFDISPRLEEAVGKGLTLHFVAEFELSRPRWYWFDEKVVQVSQTWRLTYHALTRQYRLSTGALHQSFPSLDDALRVLSHIRKWTIAERDRLVAGETLDASLRVRLDTSQLPKPFQVEALSNKDWILTSDWKRWSFVVPRPVPVPPSAVGTEEAK
jgi:hypothetical protein